MEGMEACSTCPNVLLEEEKDTCAECKTGQKSKYPRYKLYSVNQLCCSWGCNTMGTGCMNKTEQEMTRKMVRKIFGEQD